MFTKARRGEDQPVVFASYFYAKAIHYIDKPFYFYRHIPLKRKIKLSPMQYESAFILYDTVVPLFTKYNLYPKYQNEIDQYLCKNFIAMYNLIPHELQKKFIKEANSVLSTVAFAMFQQELRRQKIKMWTSKIKFILSFKKKKVGDNVIKELSIFGCPVIKFNVTKK